MNQITCNGFSTKLILKDNALLGFTSKEIEILQHDLESYSFVNCKCFGARYFISCEEWIANIKKLYDINYPRIAAIINVLNKLV